MVKINAYCNVENCPTATLDELLNYSYKLESERQEFLQYLRDECPVFDTTEAKTAIYRRWLEERHDPRPGAASQGYYCSTFQTQPLQTSGPSTAAHPGGNRAMDQQQRTPATAAACATPVFTTSHVSTPAANGALSTRRHWENSNGHALNPSKRSRSDPSHNGHHQHQSKRSRKDYPHNGHHQNQSRGCRKDGSH